MKLFGIAAILAFTMAAPAAAQDVRDRLYRGITGEEMVRILYDLGYRAELGTAGDGTPKISTSTGGTRFTIYFYNCDGRLRGRCEDVQYSAGWDLNDPPSLRRINAWNRAKRFTAAWLDDEDDPFLEMDVDLYGGATGDQIVSTLNVYESSLGEFEDWIGY